MPHIETGGARVAYDVSGEGPALVLGHSLLCDRSMWAGVLPRLEPTHRVINVEARGHGDSTAPAAFTLEDLADDWRRILDREHIERAILCGLSMGGMTAMRLALAHPERVAALVLLDTSAEPERPMNRLRYRSMGPIYRRFGAMRPLVHQIAAIMLSRTSRRTRPELTDRLAAMLHRHDRRALLRAVEAVASRGSIAARLDEIRCPTLVAVGAEDRATSPARSRLIQARIPGAAPLAVIPDAGHLSALERPHWVGDRIAEFLAEPGETHRQGGA